MLILRIGVISLKWFFTQIQKMFLFIPQTYSQPVYHYFGDSFQSKNKTFEKNGVVLRP